MMLTTKARYGVMALVDIAMQNRFMGGDSFAIKLSDVSERQKIPLNYLEQLFAKLKAAGLVKSVRGPGGGYKIAKDFHKVTVGEIISAVDEPIKIVKCGNNPNSRCNPDSTNQCVAHDLWDALTRHIEDYVDSITLADVISRRLKFVAKDEFEELVK